MSASAHPLHQHLERVQACRTAAVRDGLAPWVSVVRQVQVLRFRHTYADLLDSPGYGQATAFFLNELYGSDDYEERDAQFARIASALERLFPPSVLTLALQLAQVHALTEELDLALARAWAEIHPQPRPDAFGHPDLFCVYAYVNAWQHVGRRPDRDTQLASVVDMGRHLSQVVRIPGLRTALKLMRSPARAAGLSLLQGVLEEGFDAFRSLRDPQHFLDTIEQREAAWMAQLFDRPGSARAELVGCLTLSA